MTMGVDMDMGILVPSLSITREEFCQFHSIDRSLYAILVMTLLRDPVESMLVVALFLWLEMKGFRNVVKNALMFPHLIINELAKEAVTCLKRINVISGPSASSSASTGRNDDIPFMRKLVGAEITIQFLYAVGGDARKGVSNMFDKVCGNALMDIMQAAIITARSPLSPCTRMNTNQSPMSQQWQMQERGFPTRTVGFWGDDSNGKNCFQKFTMSMPVPAEERTLFVTFSKGYPVHECEVREFFTRAYGDCIEALHMQEVPTFEQALFARVVFRSATTINLILDSSGKAKFVINGKHVWARKFVPKRNKINESPVFLPPSFPYSI